MFGWTSLRSAVNTKGLSQAGKEPEEALEGQGGGEEEEEKKKKSTEAEGFPSRRSLNLHPERVCGSRRLCLGEVPLVGGLAGLLLLLLRGTIPCGAARRRDWVLVTSPSSKEVVPPNPAGAPERRQGDRGAFGEASVLPRRLARHRSNIFPSASSARTNPPLTCRRKVEREGHRGGDRREPLDSEKTTDLPGPSSSCPARCAPGKRHPRTVPQNAS
ncbi:hypothetical protein JRQ81_011779 [Phrynocephalus forsythii]|uniref:Uncharacterized protein n=1 Tax=Phrynocephalus forsythii TaxID=171643 RepID=A0A9Q1AQT8_9SAUR|nr:hypothetical protein JRQ81_011779 [Phrynocephalus forsythii]